MAKLINQPADREGQIVETFDDIAAALQEDQAAQTLFWSPLNAASIHGVLWFAELQRQATAAFPELKPIIALDCGDRADLAHASMCEGMRVICFRGEPAMLAKLQNIAAKLGARVETTHPAQTEDEVRDGD
ncbi:MAG: hypothetical protein ABWY00_08910 [Dongiaceae bacterium]